jgi:hypothetical protein
MTGTLVNTLLTIFTALILPLLASFWTVCPPDNSSVLSAHYDCFLLYIFFKGVNLPLGQKLFSGGII